jgi:hypothetical protein
VIFSKNMMIKQFQKWLMDEVKKNATNDGMKIMTGKKRKIFVLAAIAVHIGTLAAQCSQHVSRQKRKTRREVLCVFIDILTLRVQFGPLA